MEIAQIKDKIAKGTADRYAQINLDYLTQQRAKLVKAMSSDASGKDAESGFQA